MFARQSLQKQSTHLAYASVAYTVNIFKKIKKKFYIIIR